MKNRFRQALSNPASLGLAILSFCMPPAGALLWWAFKAKRPQWARSAGGGAFLGLVTNVALLSVLAVLLTATGHPFSLSSIRELAQGTGPGVVQAAASPDPIEFARSTYIGLSHGDPAVESAIDFENLSAGGMSIGATYSLIPDEARKAAFRKEFLAQYAKAFHQSGASIESLTNWRIDSGDSTQVTVAATIPDGNTALVVMSKRANELKVIGFNMR